MMRRAFAVLFVAGFLAGCSDTQWDHALSYVGLDSTNSDAPAPQPAAAATPAPAPAPAESWCAEVAKAAQTEAADNGFDAATQQRRAQSAFAQCARPAAQ